MVYKYVFVPGINSNIFIISLQPCDFIQKWRYCIAPYTLGTPCLNDVIRVVKTSQIPQVKIMSGSRATLSDNLLTPNPDSQVGGSFGHKDNKKNLKPKGIR